MLNKILYFLLLFGFCHNFTSATQGPHHRKPPSYYLLPQDHPLKQQLDNLFSDSNTNLFSSAEAFKAGGFKVKLGHQQLMVGSHPALEGYLIKKFSDRRDQRWQKSNFIKRIEGAKKIRRVIEKNQFKHLIVPSKWLYKLPEKFSDRYQTTAYLLVVEKMNILDDWENPHGEARKHYYNIDQEVLTELCTILHTIHGCDAFPRNQPFVRDGKIAFVDTEHVGRLKGHFIKHIVPALNDEMQAYAIALWFKLEEARTSVKAAKH